MHIVVKRTIDLSTAPTNNNDKAQKDVGFINSAPFRFCISRTNNTLVDNAEDLDFVMPIYNMLDYSGNYSMTWGRLWNC